MPDGFAHGFCVLCELADVTYKVSSYYDPELESGFAFDDPDVAIEWPAEQRADRFRARPQRAGARRVRRRRLPLHATAMSMRERLAVTPTQFRRVAYVTLAALTLIVLTGAAVRLTDSGLGCPNWPNCGGTPLPPLSSHALIEFGNRAVSGLVGVITLIAAVLAFTRRPFRRDLAVLAVLLPLGVVAQAVLGGFTVLEHLAPGFVMAHFSLSMLILIAAVALAWRSTYEPGSRPRARRPRRRLVDPGPARARRADDLRRHRRDGRRAALGRRLRPARSPAALQGRRHADVGGPSARGDRRPVRGRGDRDLAVRASPRRLERVIEPLTVLGVLLAAQGLVGSVQYELHLPSDMVWVHVGLATATWLVALWSVAVAGRLVPRRCRGERFAANGLRP